MTVNHSGYEGHVVDDDMNGTTSSAALSHDVSINGHEDHSAGTEVNGNGINGEDINSHGTAERPTNGDTANGDTANGDTANSDIINDDIINGGIVNGGSLSAQENHATINVHEDPMAEDIINESTTNGNTTNGDHTVDENNITTNGYEDHFDSKGINEDRVNLQATTNGHVEQHDTPQDPADYVQEPIAVVGLACRLPDTCNSPHDLWKFLEAGRVAKNTPPPSRFNLDGHYDGLGRNKTMASPGGMFLQDIDPADIDAQFFKLSGMEALALDPQQRQLLEVVYEGLENGGIALEDLDGQQVGCFVGSFACDFGDIQARDPEDRAPASAVGVSRAMLSNRISHFLNIRGPSMTIDTACSGSLVGLDVACRYLSTKEINGAIVAGCNLYLAPEHVLDGANGTASLTGKCHTFDEKTDGYIKSEAVNMVYIKRLSDALRDRDPIRAIIRGTATNSDGWTAGIGSPDSAAQARAIRAAYSNAGITDLSATSYVECHGTGTRVGDIIETAGLSSVFGPSRTVENPLRIGSIKANIGHSEPSAGISGLLKAVLSLEKGIIPGQPTLITPNPKIDFTALKVLPSKTATKWPDVPFRRAGVNSFGFGGSNAHAIVDAAGDLARHVSSYLAEGAEKRNEDAATGRPYLLALSANDEESLRAQYASLGAHLVDNNVDVHLRDLAYTLSERRTRHFHRGYAVINSTDLPKESLATGKLYTEPPKIGFIFTGQGAQWSQMGKELLATYPVAVEKVRYLDEVLQKIPGPPNWFLFDVLTQPQDPEHLKRPEISQSACTAFQLAMLAVLTAAGVTAEAVAGHSSGEIAAAVAAGLLTPEQAIKVAYYRGLATSGATFTEPLGMLAAGLSSEAVAPYLEGTSVQVACFNSPASITLSGQRSELEVVETKLKADSHFARMLLVNAAYHSRHMASVAVVYRDILETLEWPQLTPARHVPMFSSTTGKIVLDSPGSEYWVTNMVSPVLFEQSVSAMLSSTDSVDVLIEIGPSNALNGPVTQIKTAISSKSEYIPAWKRGSEALPTFLALAGKLFTMGSSMSLAAMNVDKQASLPSVIVDLPNYKWNHSTKYWYENDASKEWRFKKFLYHDLLGSKIMGTPWSRPVWRNRIKLWELPFLRDHKIGEALIFPASGYVVMAIEAMFQKAKTGGQIAPVTEIYQVGYTMRDISFLKGLSLDDADRGTSIRLSLTPCFSTPDSWHEFTISSVTDGVVSDHCRGRICIAVDQSHQFGSEHDVRPLSHSSRAELWYKAMTEVGYNFGPSFQRLVEIEATAGVRQNRALVTFAIPESKTLQSTYPIHPSSIDSCFQAGAPSLWSGHRSSVGKMLLPVMIDQMDITPQSTRPELGIAVAEAKYVDAGRTDDPQRYKTYASVYNEKSGELLLRVSGLQFHAEESANSTKPHPYTHVTWRADISFMSNEKLTEVLRLAAQGTDSSAAATLIKLVDLIAHKTPDARIREANLVGSHSFWIDQVRPTVSQIAVDCEYTLSVSSADLVTESREIYVNFGSPEVDLHDPENPFAEIDPERPVRILVVKVPQNYAGLEMLLESARKVISSNGYVLVLEDVEALDAEGNTPDLAVANNPLPKLFKKILGRDEPTTGNTRIAYLGAAIAPTSDNTEPATQKEIQLVRFQTGNETRPIENALQDFQLVERTLPLDGDLPEGSTILVLDEMFSSIFSNVNDEQILALKKIVEKKCRLLWVTVGGQMQVSLPERSLFIGVARALLSEDPGALIMSLDVESSSSHGSLAAIVSGVRHLSSIDSFEFGDNEFAEKDGLLHVCRVIPDLKITKHESAAVKGPELQMQSLHKTETHVRLVTDSPGALDNLYWKETTDGDFIEDDKVEVEIHAAALNLKDVANALGFVPANEHQFGLEGAGVVTRVGKDNEKFKPGDRVLIITREGGCFANKVKHVADGIHHIPDWMSFADATTMGFSYSTSLYSLIDLANVRKGESVLIQNATDGVGLAAMQVCRYLGAEIYVTFASDEKKKFLQENCGIPENRMFSSETTAFASELMEATNGRGVDVILNTLTGDILHESWRCIAENGRFIELSRKDIMNRSSISMEPFSRNACYRSFDLSQKCVSDAVSQRLMALTMKLASEGHITPIHIGKTFPFDEIVEAFRYRRDGKSLGKIIVTDTDRDTVNVPTKLYSAPFQLNPNVSYLISGGLKGLCGSLAISMARQGARNIVALSRSGHDDKISQSVVHQLASLGATVDLVRGDVTNIEDVRRAFREASKPVGGIIQGAMLLRDKLFPTMTPDEFRAPLEPKVRGTWNLHTVSQEQEVPLEFFTMLSSISGVMGHSAQVNYAAGNVFQDAFAWYRHSLGLTACSVDLGLIKDVGYFADRDHFSRRLESKGWPPINETLLHRILRLSILQQTSPINPDSAVQLVTGIPYPLNKSSPLKPHHRFSGLRLAAGGAAGGEAGDSHLALIRKSQQGIEVVDHDTLLGAVVEVINGILRRSLGWAEPLEPSRPLASYGIDSLVAVELRNWVRSELSVEVGVVEVVGAKTLLSLCEVILKKL